MYTLFIDTHDKETIVILYKETTIIKQEVKSTNTQSEVLLPLISSLFSEAKLNIKCLTKVIVVNGPGSFTGVRLGITVAKTIAYSLKIPIYSITSLALMAHFWEITDEATFGITDSKGVYLATFDATKNLKSAYKYQEKSYLSSKEIIFDLKIKYEKLLINNANLILEDCFLIKPLYVKKIEVLK